MLNNPYQPKSKSDASYFVLARQKVFISSVEIYIPNSPYEKIEPGYELADSTRIAPSTSPLPTSEEDKLERTKRRAYSMIKDYALSNSFELFATFTFKEDRQDPDKCRLKLNGWLKRARKSDKNFQYIVVPELHKDRESLHFHALIKGYSGALQKVMNPKTGRTLVKRNRTVYDFPSYTLGHSEVYKIGATEEDRIRSSRYLLKYVKKDMPAFKNKKRYWTSRGLDRPAITENPEEWYLGVKPDHLLQSEYGTYFYFDRDRVEGYLNEN